MTKIKQLFKKFGNNLVKIIQSIVHHIIYPGRRTVVFCYDIGICMISMQLAYWLYYGENQIYFSEFFILKQMAVYGFLCAGCFTLLQTYRPLWKYLNFTTASTLLVAVIVAAGLYTLCLLRFNVENIRIAPMLSLITGTVSYAAMILSRIIYKLSLRWTLTAENQEFTSISDTRILIYGHDKLIKNYLININQLEHTNLDIVGIVTDKSEKIGQHVAGYPIVCTLQDIESYITELNAEGQHPHKMLISTSALRSVQIRHLLDITHRHNMYLQKIPSPNDVTHEGILPLKLKLEDLFTDFIHIESNESLSHFYNQQTVMIIGAGGMIGLNLIDQLKNFSVQGLIVCESDQRQLAELKDCNSSEKIHFILTKGYTYKHFDYLIKYYKPSLLINLDSITEQTIAVENPLETLYENLLVPVMLARLAKKYQIHYFINTRPSFLSLDQTIITPLNNILEAWCQEHDVPESPTRFVTIHLPNFISQDEEWIKSLRLHAKQGRPSTIYLKSQLDNIISPNMAAHILLENIFLFSCANVFKASIHPKNDTRFTSEQIVTMIINLFHLSRDQITIENVDHIENNTYFESRKNDIVVEGQLIVISHFIPIQKKFDINIFFAKLEKIYHQFDKNKLLEILSEFN